MEGNLEGEEGGVPPPLSGEGVSPLWADDTRAKNEDKYWPNEDKLKAQSSKNNLRYIVIIGWLVPIFMISASVLFIAAIGVWAWHFLTPWVFLETEQLVKSQSVLFSGSLGAVISTYVQRHILK